MMAQTHAALWRREVHSCLLAPPSRHVKSDSKSGKHCDAYRIVVALSEREEHMSSRGDRGELLG